MAVLLAGLGLACADTSWEAAARKDTVAAYHQFLRDHPESSRASEARERLAYRRVVALPKIPSFEKFVGAYPSSSFLPKLQALLEPAYFARARSANTVGAYRSFLERYPDGKLTAKAAGNQIWVDGLAVHPEPDRLRRFIENHPESDYIEQAQSTLDLLHLKIDTAIHKLAISVDVAPDIRQPDRVRRGFAAVVARSYQEKGIETVLIPSTDELPVDVGWAPATRLS